VAVGYRSDTGGAPGRPLVAGGGGRASWREPGAIASGYGGDLLFLPRSPRSDNDRPSSDPMRSDARQPTRRPKPEAEDGAARASNSGVSPCG
jgi:hypothetical protein